VERAAACFEAACLEGRFAIAIEPEGGVRPGEGGGRPGEGGGPSGRVVGLPATSG
jgi:hypothetical protein